jgi:CTP synthase
VVSSLGKGLAAASIGCLLEGHGYRVALQKFDPYINVDPGTMSPFQHGEVYVTDDGAETDLDLGHYERFTEHGGDAEHNWTTGKIYLSVIQKERRGDYLGAPCRSFRTSPTRSRTPSAGGGVDVVLVEIGGTVGDIESLPFLEAIRQFRQDVGRENTLYIHLTLVPYIGVGRRAEDQADAAQRARSASIGIQPDVLLCRTDRFLDPDIKRKIALFCDVDEEAVITAATFRASTRCRSPGRRGLDRIILKRLHLPETAAGWSAWEDLVDRIRQPPRRDHDSRRREVRRLRGLLQEPQRGALPRRASSTG